MTLEHARSFATEAHKNQFRKNDDDEGKPVPYITHPIRVMEWLRANGVDDENVLMAALLHDTIEDTPITEDDLRREFGDKVTTIVLECSDNKADHKIQRKRDQITHAANASVEAKLVKLGDKYDNASGLFAHPPKEWSEEEIRGYIVWCYAVVKQCRGINQKIDNAFDELFAKAGVANLTDEQLTAELELYYRNINKSE